MLSKSSIAVTSIMLAAISCGDSARLSAESPAIAGEIFTRRILPILLSQSGSSCTECHFTGVELSDYIFEDQAKTFAALRNSGLIDIEAPDQSKILTFIARTPERSSPELQQLRQREYEAFQTWLRAAIREPQLLAAETSVSVGTELPVEVIRHARKDRVLAAFMDNVWSELARCVNCHSPEKNRHAIQKHGKEYVDSISWIVPRDPGATLERLVEDGDIDLDHPEQSPLLTKPSGRAEHGGGRKFLVGDPADEKFLAFLTDYAAIRQGQYKSAEELPAASDELVLLTEQHLRITDLPAGLHDQALRIDLYLWDPDRRQWSERRVGTAFNAINAQKQLWQSIVSVAVPSDSARVDELRQRPRLPRGAYLAKLAIEPIRKGDDEAGERRFFTQFEITGEWPRGYQPPKTVAYVPPGDRADGLSR